MERRITHSIAQDKLYFPSAKEMAIGKFLGDSKERNWSCLKVKDWGELA